MRNLINIVEAALAPAEISKYNGKYLEILIQLISTGTPIAVDTTDRPKLGDAVEIDKSILPALNKALADPDNIKALLPNKIPLTDGRTISWSNLLKGPEFTGLDVKQKYNIGHLAELFMGVAVFSKFANLGGDINVQQVMVVMSYLQQSTQKGSYAFDLTKKINYPESGSKEDTVYFKALVPGNSAQEFINQLATGKLDPKLTNVLTSAVKFANESGGVANACQRVRADRNNNTVQVVSDGTSDAKGTKADMILTVDGQKINLLSLKADSKTLGQYSGLTFQNVQNFFSIGLGIDITPYRSYFDPTLGKEKLFQNLCVELYDKVIYPQVTQMVEDQSPATEASIVKQLSRAANIFARGEKLEDIIIIKLDDAVAAGNYKVMRYTDNLYDAMKHLDLDVKLTTREKGRTLQILVKPKPGEKLGHESNLLCQFRTQLMGDYPRNYFEVGDVMEDLVSIDERHSAAREPATRQPQPRTAPSGVGREQRT
jgi:hypothetical protein